MHISILSALLSKVLPLADYYDYGDYGDYGYGGSGDEVAVAALTGFYVVYLIFCLVIGILGVIAYWKIFTKARKPGWHAIVPYLNMYTLFDIIYGNGWKFLLMLVPGLNAVLAIMMLVRLGQAFNKSTGFIVGLVFLTPIFLLILAFGDARYRGPQKDCFI
ncbi:MAG: hypothetical protein IKN55_11595 [Oscillospiraceae bacterium]|nr:hypothetical protein [Oscillospiraceae bacterium]